VTIEPLCIGCNKHPREIDEYSADYIREVMGRSMSAAEFVRLEEGTYNRETGHFLCTGCYIDRGMPSSPGGWVAP
jgi:hypothetical protein